MRRKVGKVPEFWNVRFCKEGDGRDFFSITIPYFIKWKMSEIFTDKKEMTGGEIKARLEDLKKECREDLLRVRITFSLVEAWYYVISGILEEKQLLFGDSIKYKVVKIEKV